MNADPRIAAVPDIHGHAKGEHKPFAEERPIPYTARMLFLWFYHACRRSSPRFLMVSDHINYLTFEDPAAVNLVRRALKLAQAGDLYGAAETAGVELVHAAAVSEGLRKGMRYSIGAEVDNDPRSRPDAQNIVDAMRPDGMIRSVHFLPIAHPQHGENWMWPFDNADFREFFDVVGTEQTWELYVTTLIDAIEKLPGHIVGHFYVPAKFGHWPEDAKLESYEDRLLDACAERGMAIEINSRYFYKYYASDDAQIERYRTAYLRLLRKAKSKGVMVAVGSDAHSPKDQGGAFDTVLALLDEAEVNEIAFPINGRLARVALRATEEIMRQHSAALAGPAPAERFGGTDNDSASARDDAAVVEAAPQKAAESATESAPVAARVRPKPKPRPVEKTPVEKTHEAPQALPERAERAPEPVAETVPPSAKKRPPKRKLELVEASHASEAGTNGSPAQIVPPDDVTPAAPAAAQSESVVAAAERIIEAVAETAKRASSSLVEAATNLLSPKPRRVTHSGKSSAKTAPVEAQAPAKVSRPKAPGHKHATVTKAPAARIVAKPAPKPPAKSVAKPSPKAPAKETAAKTSSKKAAPKKAAVAKAEVRRAAPKKAAPKKAASPARPPAKKAASQSGKAGAKGAKKTAARHAPPAKSKRPAAPKRGAPKRAAPKKSNAKKTTVKKKAARSRR